MHKIDDSHIPPLRIAERYGAFLRHGQYPPNG